MLLGIVLIIVGICVIAYSSSITEMFGRRTWADQHLGGTMQAYVLIGFGIIIVGAFVAFGGKIKTQAPDAFPGGKAVQQQVPVK